MRILFLSQIVPYPPHGGVLQRGYNLVRQIGSRNELFLLAFVHPDVLGTPAMLEESRLVLGRHCRHIEYFRLWPKASPLTARLAYAWGAFSRMPFSVLAHRSREFATAIAGLVEREAIDLVHYDTLALAQFEGCVVGIPRTLTHHNVESQLMSRRAEKDERFWARQYLRRQAARIRAYESAQCRKFDLNIVVSETDARTLDGIAPGVRTETIHNGVDIDYFQPGSTTSTTPPSLIYTGGMNMFANRDAVMHFLREIWPVVKNAVPDVVFRAVGQDPPAELLTMARQDAGIVVTGYVDDIRPLVRTSAVYVVPLRVGGGTRLKVVDAMAMGKAIVSTSVGAEGLRVTDGLDIVLRDDPRDFARATIDLLGDPGHRDRLGSAARKLAEGAYSWDLIGRKLQDTYEGLVRDRGVARVSAPRSGVD